MKKPDDNEHSQPNHAAGSEAPDEGRRRKRHSRWRIFGMIVVILVVMLGVARAFLPWIVRDYVNRTIGRNLLYTGRIGPVTIRLLRGAYSISDVRLDKTTGDVPVPFFAAKRIGFAVQWDALLHGKVVCRVLMQEPQLHFVEAESSAESQSGGGGPWLSMLQQLVPFTINRAEIVNGTIHFQVFQSANPVDVYVSQFNASIDDLSNIRDSTDPLVATVRASGLVMDEAKLDLKMTLDPFAYHPTFHLIVRLLGLDVTKLNDLSLSYGKFDFKRGWLDLVVEANATEGQINGYVKPLFRDLEVFNLAAEVKQGKPLQAFWESLVGAATSIFKNYSRNQFGTLVPFSGDLSGKTTINTFATIGNVLRNAFVRAYLPRLQPGQANEDNLQFQAPDFTQEEAIGGAQ